MNKIDVLDKGYVRLVDQMGTDLSVVNAARVSYDKESKEFELRDEKLLKYLWKAGHTSPFRHAVVSFEVYAPLMVARQWYKHAVASAHLDDQNGWNESSRRYITEDEEFYVPTAESWRSKPENSKQGSGDCLDGDIGADYTDLLTATIRDGVWRYQMAMERGVAAEQARLFLPAYAMYVRWRWTISLHGALHFLDLRKEHASQYEIQQYAIAVDKLLQTAFPGTHKVIFDSE